MLGEELVQELGEEITQELREELTEELGEELTEELGEAFPQRGWLSRRIEDRGLRIEDL